jgi:AsmA protein
MLAIVGGVLVVLVVAGVLILDRVLLRVAKDQAAKLSAELGRPIGIEGVATRLWGGLGAKVTGLSVGAGPGESVPLLELRRAEVSPYLWRLIRSGGDEVGIREVVVEGLRVNVEKLKDGTTNVERLAKKLKERGPPAASAEPAPQAVPGEERRPPALEVGRAALENARIAFLDRTVPGAKELFVDDLDAEVRDLRVGEPLELRVKAAVLAAKQNLDLTVKAAPLPPTLVPTVEHVVLKVQPIDLGPLAPFLPKAVALRGGRFQADLDADLGGAVPGGEGKTRVVGGFRASELAFAGQAEGKRLDASLAADVTADLRAGDLALDKLELVVGPAALIGKGRASGLLGKTPKVEGLEISSRGLDPAAIVEVYPPLRKQLGGAVAAGPIGLSLRGNGSAEAQRIELRVDLGPVRLAVPRQLEKAAGAPMVLTARADAEQGGRIRFDANADLGGVDLRPGGTVAKKPGDPLSLQVSGAYGRPDGRTELTLSRLALNLLGDTLSGKGKVAMAGAGKSATATFDAELSGEQLDLDRLLMERPETKKKKEEPASKPNPSAFAGLSGEARLRLGRLKVKGVEARNVLARVKVKGDLVTLEQAQLQAFGGSVNAAGTLARLAHPDEPFKVVTKLKGVEAQQALGLFTKQKLLTGTLDMDLDLNGPGLGKASLLEQVSGVLDGEIRDGTFHGMDLIAAAAGPLAAKLPFMKKPAESKSKSTSLGKQLPFGLQIRDGVAKLARPLKFDTGQGQVELNGGIGLDGSLHLPATVALSPEFVAKLTGGKVKPDGPVPLTLRIGGAATSPRIEGVNVDAAAKALASQAATGALGKALGLGSGGGDDAKGGAKPGQKQDPKKQLEGEAKKRFEGLFGK